MSFSQLPAVIKDTILGAARISFGPSYFVMALKGLENASFTNFSQKVCKLKVPKMAKFGAF